MEARKYFRSGDHLKDEHAEEPGQGIDLSPFIGTWVNTKKETTGFVKLMVASRDGHLVLKAFGTGDGELSDWGQVEAFPFSDRVDTHNGRAFSAFYDTGFAEVTFQGNLNLGLLVLVTFTRFKDGSGRSNYICREFFHR